MANHKSALKQHRQDRVRRDRNRQHRSRLRTAVKRCRQAIEAGEADLAASLLPGTLSLLDRSSKKGAIAENSAARAKSRLTLALNGLVRPATRG